MAEPRTYVEIAFDSDPNAEEASILWTDVSDDLRSINITRGRSQELDLFQPGQATVVLNNAARQYDPTNLAGPHVQTGRTQIVPMKRLRVRTEHPNGQALTLGSGGTSHVSTPDSSALSITGDLDLRIKLAADNWVTLESGTGLVYKGVNSYRWYMSASNMWLEWGSEAAQIASYADLSPVKPTWQDAFGWQNGQPIWLRVTLDCDNGEGNSVTTFYWSQDGANWQTMGTQLETVETPDDDSNSVYVGSWPGGEDPFPGTVYEAQIYDGIDGTLVANPNFADSSQWTVGDDDGDTGTDDQGNLWTLDGPDAEILGWTTIVPLFEGYIDGWRQVYNGPNDATTEITVTDGFKVLAKTALPTGPFAIDVAATNPTYWWRLGDPAGSSSARDEIQGDLMYTLGGAGTFGEQGLLSFDSDTAYSQPAEDGLDYLYSGTAAVLPASTEQRIKFPGGSGTQGVWTAKHASFTGLAAMDVRIRMSETAWSNGLWEGLVGQAGFSPSTFFQSWQLTKYNDGRLALLLIKADGNGEWLFTSDSLADTYADGEVVWLGFTVAHTGSNNFEVNFYHCADGDYDSDITTWTADSAGTQSTNLGQATLNNPGGAIELCIGNAGSLNSGTLYGGWPCVAEFYEVQIRNAVNGTIVANPDFTDDTQWSIGETGGGTGSDSTGKVWKISSVGTAWPRILAGTQPFSWSGLVKYDGDEPNGTGLARIIAFQGEGAPTNNLWQVFMYNNGKAGCQVRSGDSGGTLTSSAVIGDGAVHHVAFTYSATGSLKLYVDGVQDQTATVTSPVTLTEPGICIGNSTPPNIDTKWPGVIDEVLIWDRDLSADEIEALYNSAMQPWAGDTTGQRINKILDAVGWPASRRNIDQGDSVLQAGGFGSDALNIMQTVAKSELVGSMFIGKNGALRFISRGNQYNRVPVVTFTDVYGDDPSIRAMEPEYGDWLIRNDITVSRDEGKPQRATSPESIQRYLIHSWEELTGLQHNSDELSAAVATSLVAQYAEPKLRISALTILPRSNPEVMFPIVTALELGDWIELEYTPQGVGDPVVVTSVVEQISMTIANGEKEWVVTLNLSPAPVDVDPVGVISGDSPAPSGNKVNVFSLDNRLSAVENDVDALQAAIGPIGSITLWPSDDIPIGWLVCDGSSFDAGTYPTLSSVLGSTTLPDLRDRVPVGTSGSKGVLSTGGAASVTLVHSNLPNHSHTIAHTHQMNTLLKTNNPAGTGASDNGGDSVVQGTTSGRFNGGQAGSTAGSSAANSGTTPGGTAGVHNSVPVAIQNPYVSLNFIIRAA